MLEWLFGKKEPPMKKVVYVQNLVIEAMESGRPKGSSQTNPTGAAILRTSAITKGGKLWIDYEVAGHELQHILAGMDPDFGQPDESVIK